MREKLNAVRPAWLAFLLGLLPLALGFLLGHVAAPPARGRPQPAVAPRERGRWRLVAGGVLLGAALLFLAWLLPQVREVLIVLYVSLILAAAIRPLALGISGRQIPGLGRGLPLVASVLLIYLGFFVTLGLLGLYVVPRLVGEAQSLAENAPEYAEEISAFVARFADYPAVPTAEEAGQMLQDQLASGVGSLLSAAAFLFGLLGGLLSVVTIFLITLFLVKDADKIRATFVGLLPATKQAKAGDVLDQIGEKFSGWIVATLMLALVVGVSTVLGLMLLGVPYPVLLGLVAALGEFIPMVGPFLGAVPALLVAVSQSWQTVFLVAGLFLLIQQLESNVLAPKIMGSRVHLHPLLVVVGLLTGGSLMGITGALLAVPTVAVLQVLWTEVFVPWVKGVERLWGAE